MTRRWPDTLPGASLPGYSLSPKDQTRRTDMDSGAQRVRRITSARLDRVGLTWNMTDAEFWAFRAWFSDDLVSLIGASDSLSAWGLVNATRSVGIVLGPDMVMVDRILETVDVDVHGATKSIPAGATNNVTMTLCATLKAAGRSLARLAFFDRNGVEAYATVNLATGAIVDSLGASNLVITSRGTGWWRIQYSASTGFGAGTPFMQISPLDGAGATSYAGDTSLGISVAEVQCRFESLSNLFVPCDASGYSQGASGGSAWFFIPLAFGSGLSTVEGRFTEGTYQAQAGAALRWAVTAQAEVRNA